MPLRRLSNPARLPRSPSLNLTVLADLDGLPQIFAGTRARDWLTAWSIARSMAACPGVVAALEQHRLEVTQLPSEPEVSTGLMEAAAAWPAALDALLTIGDERAVPVADRLGDALAAVVATLANAPVEARRARPDWSRQYWESWRSVRSIVIGGGIVRGVLGDHVVDGATTRLQAAGIDVRLTKASEAAALGLLGAASLLQGTGVALDCGGTVIKRALVTPDARGRHVMPLPCVPAPGRVDAEQVIDAIADAAEVSGVPSAGSVEVALAIATYVDNSGQPYAGQLGPYAPLGDVDLHEGLADAIRLRTGAGVSLRIIHDGAAALLGARVYQPETDAAIVLGTAIGCGLGRPRG